MTLSTAQGFIGAGDVYLRPFLADGTAGKLVDTGNTTKLTIKPNSDIKRQISKKRATYGNPLSQLALQQPAEIALTLETVNRTNLRYAFMGEDATYAQTAATVTNETAILRLDGWVQLANEELGPTVTVSIASAAKVEGVDFEVNRRLGMIRAIPGGSITDLASATVGYTALAFTGAAIRGNVNPSIRAFLLLDGLNKVDDSVGILRVWEAVLTPTSEFDWFKDDFNTIDLAGTLTVPAGYSEPFRFYAR